MALAEYAVTDNYSTMLFIFEKASHCAEFEVSNLYIDSEGMTSNIISHATRSETSDAK